MEPGRRDREQPLPFGVEVTPGSWPQWSPVDVTGNSVGPGQGPFHSGVGRRNGARST